MTALARLAANRRSAALLSILLAAIVFVALNTAVNAWFRTARVDLTENGLYTLSEGTKNILRGLKEPITLRFYYSAEQAKNYPTVRAHAERVRDLLNEYRAVAGPNLIVEEIDPQPFTEAEDAATGAGLQGAPTQGGEVVYMGLEASNMADGQEVVPFFPLDREQFLEYDLTSIVYRLAQTKKPVLGLVTNLPLDTGPGGLLASMQGQSQPFVMYSQLTQIFDVRPLEQDFDSVPSTIDAILIAHPKALSERTLYAIDQFVMRGGRVIAFVDPVSEISQLVSEQTGQPVQGATFSSDLWLLKSWGAAYNPDEVVLDGKRALPVQAGNDPARPVLAFPLWVKLVKDDDPALSDFDAGDLVTNSLGKVVLASVGHFTPVDGATTQFTPLIRSSDGAAIFSAAKLADEGADPDALMQAIQATGERYTLAARLSGPLKSAFPDGAPKPAAPKEGEPPPVLPAYLSETANANIIVVADSDIFDDRFWVGTQQQGGQTMAVPTADNLAFVASAAENMLGSNDLISLRARATSERPFTVVENLKKEADARFLAEETELNARIAATQEKLQALAAPGAGGDPAALTDEQQAEIERFRAELTDTRARLREVQHELRAGIDRLGTGLALVNIALVPALLVLAAIGFGIVRRRRMAAAQAA
jgi:ABC-type uncharacterized transport system involved in gliding motility auxiliary subunit